MEKEIDEAVAAMSSEEQAATEQGEAINLDEDSETDD